MSLAETLLDSLPDKLVSAFGIDPASEPHIVINPDRTVTVHNDLKHIAVKGDHNIETVTFDCPRYWDGHDLSEMQLRIVFQRPDGHREPHLVENLRVDSDDESVIHFDWTISGNVTAVQGNISFTVCGKLSNAEGVREREWHTRLNQDLIVDEGMDCSGEEIVEQNPDIIEAILVQLDELKNTGGVSDEQEVRDIVDEYLAENVVLFTKQTITEEQKAQARENIGAVDENYVEQAIADATSGVNLSEYELLGMTPLRLDGAENRYNIVVDVTAETTVSIVSDTVAEMAGATNVKTNNCEETTDSGIHTLTCRSTGIWHSIYKVFTLRNLVAGEKYTLMLDFVASDRTNIVGLMQIVDAANTTVFSEMIYNRGAGVKTYPFTAPGTEVNVKLYPVSSSNTVADGLYIQYRDIWINRADALEVRTDVYSFNTVTSDRLDLRDIGGAVTITATPAANIYAQAIEGDVPDGPLAGMTCVCFGDSITGNYVAPFDYPSIIARKTGMTVINGGVGGCRMAQHSSGGYTAFSMYSLADSIASGDWSVQDAAIDSVSSPNTAEHLAALKEVDWSALDFITILYGTNDFMGGVAIGEDSGMNTFQFKGALRHSIETILTAYPKIRIVLLTPIYRFWTDDGVVTDSDSREREGDGVKLTDFVDAVISVGKEYKLPVFNMYNSLGINKINRTTFLKDGVHPSEAGLERIGESIAARLISI